MSLYHAEIRLPECYVKPTGRVKLEYSRHAYRACENDRYGEIPVFQDIPLEAFETIEVEKENDIIRKYVLRGKYDATRDLVIVLIPGRYHWFVKTCWWNLRSDLHKTLDRSRYMA